MAELVKMSLNELEREIGSTKKFISSDKKLLEELKRNKDILLKELNRVEINNKKQQEEVFYKEKVCKERDNEIGCIMKELTKKSQQIAILEREKEKYGIQFGQANTKYFHSLEEIKLKDNLISEFQKKNIETEAKLKQQQSLYETVRSDRNQYSKNLTDTNEEIAEIRRKYNFLNHQIS